MSEEPTREEMIAQLAEKGIEFEIPDKLLENVAGGYDANAYNPDAVAGEMKAAIASAKKDGKGKEETLEYYILRSMSANVQFGNKSAEYQREMDKFRYVQENWDKV